MKTRDDIKAMWAKTNAHYKALWEARKAAMAPSAPTTDTPVSQVARIGQGRKLHPILVDTRYGVTFLCACPGTRNGQVRMTWQGRGEATCTH